MAEKTAKELRKQVIYSVFVRNYSREGTFAAVERDVERIKALGVDVIWLLPIHPLGVEKRKGTLGSPYAIKDYREINPEFGNFADFRRLVNKIHECGMKVIIDVVYNHTSPDSYLATHHPDWFYHKADGKPGNRVGEWWDVVDLDYSHPELWDYQIATLKLWAGEYRVDGFRCDVASMVPIAFWKRAREAVEKERADMIWLAESVDPEFILNARANGFYCASDSELMQVFDICYDYDIYSKFSDTFTSDNALETYAEAINRQEWIYPDNYIKLRFLENHDRPRAAYLIENEKALRNWTAFIYFQKGITMIYNGQEMGVKQLPGLFDLEPIDWKDGTQELSSLMQRMNEVKKQYVFSDGSYRVMADGSDVLIGVWIPNGLEQMQEKKERLVGIFTIKGNERLVSLRSDLCGHIADGKYINLVSGEMIEIQNERLRTDGEPIILAYRWE